jgi:hypothetical protein
MTLLGPESACQSFVGGIGASVQTYYCIAHRTANEWEVGIGTISASPDSLSRDTVLASSNSGSAVDFSAGTKDVFCTHNAERTAYFDHNNRLIVSHTSGDTLWISHDGTANLFETNAGSFKFTADASLTDATIVVDINGVGTGNGKLRIWDEDTEYLEAYCDNGNGFIEVKSAGGTAGHIFFQYSGNGDVRSFYGTENNPFFRIYGYDGASQQQILFWVSSSGAASIGSTAGQDIRVMPQSSSSYATTFQSDGDVYTPKDLHVSDDLDVGGNIEIPSTSSGLTEGVITQNGSRVFHTYAAPGTSGNNTFLGRNTGTTGLTGTSGDASSYNLGFGYNCLGALTTGRSNNCIGVSCGDDITTGNGNTAVGYAAAFECNTGSYNCFFGYYAGFKAEDANYQVAIGYRACYSNVSSDDVVGVGFFSLYDATGQDNTAIGSLSGRGITTGASNVFVGHSAGHNDQTATASYSVAVGAGADTQGNYAIAIGYGVNASAGECAIGGSQITKTTLQGKLTGLSELGGLEKSADPSAPAEGEFTIWMSDGTGKGDDGDILIAVTAGGATKWKTLFDFDSEGSSW